MLNGAKQIISTCQWVGQTEEIVPVQEPSSCLLLQVTAKRTVHINFGIPSVNQFNIPIGNFNLPTDGTQRLVMHGNIGVGQTFGSRWLFIHIHQMNTLVLIDNIDSRDDLLSVCFVQHQFIFVCRGFAYPLIAANAAKAELGQFGTKFSIVVTSFCEA